MHQSKTRPGWYRPLMIYHLNITDTIPTAISLDPHNELEHQFL